MDSPRIIYKKYDGTLSVVVPASFELANVHAVAQTLTPEGEPYLIVENSSLPDASLLDAWDADFSNPSGIGRPK